MSVMQGGWRGFGQLGLELFHNFQKTNSIQFTQPTWNGTRDSPPRRCVQRQYKLVASKLPSYDSWFITICCRSLLTLDHRALCDVCIPRGTGLAKGRTMRAYLDLYIIVSLVDSLVTFLSKISLGKLLNEGSVFNTQHQILCALSCEGSGWVRPHI